MFFSCDSSRVLQEFERTISELTSERERERVLRDIEKEQIVRERDQALHDLRSVERSFSDTQRLATNVIFTSGSQPGSAARLP